MSRHSSFCSTCHARLADDAEHCPQHRSGVYMMETYGSARVVNVGPMRTAAEVLADPPRLFDGEERLVCKDCCQPIDRCACVAFMPPTTQHDAWLATYGDFVRLCDNEAVANAFAGPSGRVGKVTWVR